MATITTRAGKGSPLTNEEVDANFQGLNTDKAELSGANFTGAVDVDGNITTTGTVDGRDIASDGTKLDGIEASADVTDTANVTAAGALMDSEVTNLAQVKAFDSSDYATAAQGSTADSALQNVVEDTTPQLGGDLASNGNDILFADNDKAIFGAGSDLQIYHSGSHSIIDEAGNGDLYLRSTNGDAVWIYSGGTTSSKKRLAAKSTGEVELYYGSTTRLATTATGIDVTGTVTADGLTVDGDILVNRTSAFTNAVIEVQDDGDGEVLALNNNGTDGQFLRLYNSGTLIGGLGNNTSAVSSLNIYRGSTPAINIASNGDISFYEDTGTTAKLFWDASAESLGIGTSNPNRGILHLEGSNYVLTNSGQSLGGIHIDANTAPVAGGYTNGISFGYSAGASAIVGVTSDLSADADRQGLAFIVHGSGTGGADATEAMRIHADGNVGIGISPSTKLDIKQSTDNAFSGVRIERSTTSAQYSVLSSAQGTTYLVGVDTNDAGNNVLSFGNSGNGSTYNEAMRIDSSGNLLVGTTDSSPFDNSANSSADNGIALRSDGILAVAAYKSTANSGNVVTANRTGTDGPIIGLQKSGSTVGSIGTNSNKMYLGTGSANIRFRDDLAAIVPTDSDGSNSDADLDLGYSTIRWRDLYLSGGAYLGGTGSANKLDDYEEGTFTARLRGSTAEPATLLTATAQYQVVGHRVFVSIAFENVNTTGYSGDITVDQLPFSCAETRAVLTVSSYAGGVWTDQPIGSLATGDSTVYWQDAKTASIWGNVSHNAAGGARYFWVQGFYKIS